MHILGDKAMTPLACMREDLSPEEPQHRGEKAGSPAPGRRDREIPGAYLPVNVANQQVPGLVYT